MVNNAKSLNPAFAQIQLPPVGGPAQKFIGPIPPAFDTRIQIKEDGLGLATGEEKSKQLSQLLAQAPQKQPPFLKMSYHIGKLVSIFQTYLEKTVMASAKIREAQYKQAVERAKAAGKEPPPRPDLPQQNVPALKAMSEVMLQYLMVSYQFVDQGIETEVTLEYQAK